MLSLLGLTALLFIGLEVSVRTLVSAGALSLDEGESDPVALHPFLQNTNAPREDVVAGGRFAGWRVHPLSAAQEDFRADDAPLRLLFLGGSTTANGYPGLVRDELEANERPTVVFNLAAPMHASVHSRLKLEAHIDAVRPDVVLVMHAINDLYFGFTPPGVALPEYRSDYSHHPGYLAGTLVPTAAGADGRPVFRSAAAPDGGLRGLVSDLVRRSSLVRLIGSAGSTSGSGPPDSGAVTRLPNKELLRSLPDFAANLRRMHAICRARNVPLVVITMPFTTHAYLRRFLAPGKLARYMTNDGDRMLTVDEFVDALVAFNEASRGMGNAAGKLHILDLVTHFREPLLFRDEVHMTHVGRAQKARVVAEFLIAKLPAPR